MTHEVRDKEGHPIKVGDEVFTRIRGGTHEGKVEAVLRTEEDIKNAGDLGITVKHPPKVIFTDQHGHRVSHNPETLSHVGEGSG
ncbi:uncharacterized protein LAESUDRAFT_680079 [Laetiporus sulphureus 93-53]|uniref:Hypervirulence associated protein TUDOR domain-containing protein n=1 Tax=Laetiporus sulphureus 93-53 TaxID=1314785 RepID=A0A165E1D0_9APHY|nr:uncharacterized protein LAESUDRAFT_680079 [Laetiporus sulphureus 93-53]KZT06060.1 hypothetical protein LAESUDRAFT_680079 [Laetiporus sulphureus 93-53]